MTSSARIFFIPLALLALVTCSLSQTNGPASTTVSSASAKLVELKGDVQVQLPSQTLVPASREMSLPAGSSITTKKGSALLLLQDGSEVLVKSNSSVLLRSPEEGEHHYFDLLLGKIRAAVKKRIQGAPSFRLGTPTAVITVRGTQFEVGVNKNSSTDVTVYEGVVEVIGVGYTGQPILLGPGYMLNVPRTGVPSRPQRTIEMDDRLQRGRGRDDDSRQGRTGQFGDDRQQTTRTGTQSSGEHESPDK